MTRRRSALEKCRAVVFLAAVHVLPVVAIVRGTTAADWVTFGVVYVVLAFSVGIGLHRYFAHRAFRTSRPFQFLLGVAACAAFTDPIAFAGKHRIHHRRADREGDTHSPDDGFWTCWFWSLVDEGYADADLVRAARDWVRYPELRWLHRWFLVPGVAVGGAMVVVGGFSRLAIGYCLALALLLNLASSVNYVCHRWGSRRYATRDQSRNNALIALLSFGEGWHNNHHHYPNTARAGFVWWEIDLLYWVIRLLAALGLVWHVREVPDRVRRAQAGG